MSARSRRITRFAIAVLACGAPLGAFAAQPIEASKQAPSTGETLGGGERGTWGPVITWGLPFRPQVPIHAVLTPVRNLLTGRASGRVFTFGYYGVPDHYLWNPDTGQFQALENIYPTVMLRECGFATPPSDANLFCSGHSVLPDGRVLITGGNLDAQDLDCPNVAADRGAGHGHGSYAFAGARFTHVFDPRKLGTASEWVRAPDMRDGRWYPCNTALGDGRVLVTSGLGECSFCETAARNMPVTYTNEDLEIYTPQVGGLGTWQVVGTREIPLYPFMWLMPTGQIFYGGPGADSSIYNVPPLNGSWNFLAWSGYPYRGGGSFVGVPGQPFKIMVIGGGCCGPSSTNTVEMIDLAQANPQWQTMNPLAIGREYADATILPDKTIFVSGGRRNTWDNEIGDAVFRAEMYDPQATTPGGPVWQNAGNAARPRMYHSTALLLPDGSVWTGGGTAEGPHDNQASAEVYRPDYVTAVRPVITSLPLNVGYDQLFTVSSPNAASIRSVVLVRPSSTTHGLNMEQRLVDLQFTPAPGGGALSVRAPLNGNYAPPGYYMLFVVDSNRVPSVGQFLKLRAVQCPDCPADMNCDGFVTVGDIGGFVAAITNPAGYVATFPDCDIANADMNGDGVVSVGDISGFVQELTGL
ncbi:MAG: galactose oxidase-like domain-containing protein [Phycisphaerae bacterium]|nr:galactose oxidase-like domain-containing protein [Phycisphaerae bacterium]